MVLAVLLRQAGNVGHAWGFQAQSRWRALQVSSTTSSSFLLRRPLRQGGVARTKGPIRGRQLEMIFERMSEECIGALVTAQKESARLGQSMVDCEIMTVGVVDHPQNARATLQRKGITLRKVKQTVEDMYAESASSDSDESNGNRGGGMGQLFNMNRKARDVELPFAPPLKKALSGASKMADEMGSTNINSEHLLLALLDYNAEEKSAAVVDDNGLSYGALAVFLRLDDDTTSHDFSAADFCRDLMQDLQDAEIAGEAELVTGVSGSAKTPTLSDVGVDLTAMAAQGKLDEVYGRDKEVQSCLRTLVRRRKNNPCLVGEPGVGKTAIAEGLAQILAAPSMLQQALESGDYKDEEHLNRLRQLAQNCPSRLRGYRLVQVELANLVAGTKYRGEFEERVQALVAEVTDERAPPTLLFLDEIHTLVGAGSAEGGMDAANILKPALARGALQVLGATTISEYRKHIEKDAALERRLQPVWVKEPSVAETVGVLQALADRYGNHHGVTYAPQALQLAAKLSERYIQDRFLPDKAIDLLDEAGAIAHLQQGGNNNNNNKSSDESNVVTEEMIAQVVSEIANIPVSELTAEETDRLLQLPDILATQVKGQDRAIQAVARAVRRASSGLRDVSRPIASFLFCGPTGVGKTQLCKTLARTYFGSEKDLIRLDMSEYMDKYTVSRLTGPPPGYVGYDEGGQLTEAVRRAPFSVILLDELEKAHGDVLNILLQILEDGVLTDGKGRTCNFKNTILVMTSNVGSSRILDIWKGDGEEEASSSASTATQATAATPSSLASTTFGSAGRDMQPLSPNDVLARLQNNPTAMSLMMQAASNPEMMKAMQTAMTGSPADLLRLGKGNPQVADFLQQLWSALEEKEDEQQQTPPPSAGVAAVRQSMQQQNWNAAGDQQQDDFVSGVMQQFRSMLPGATTAEAAASLDKSQEVRQPVTTTTEDASLSTAKKMTEVVQEELEKTMRPEFLNRLDEIIVFSPLTVTHLRQIAQQLVEEATQRATMERGIHLKATPALLQQISMEGSTTQARSFGARPMRRTVQRLVEDSVSDALLRGFLQEGDEAELDWKDDSEDPTVLITRQRDGKLYSVKVDDGMGSMGTADFRRASSSDSTTGKGTKVEQPLVNPSEGR